MSKKTKSTRTAYRFTLHDKLDLDVIQTLEALPRVVRGEYIKAAIRRFKQDIDGNGGTAINHPADSEVKVPKNGKPLVGKDIDFKNTF